MYTKPRLRPHCIRMEEQKEALEDIVQELTPSFLKPYFDSVLRSHKGCIAAKGVAI